MQIIDTDHDPFEGFTARKAREELRKRKQKQLREENFEGNYNLSLLQYHLLLGWMVNLIQNEVTYTDNTQIELYLTERFLSTPKKWTDPIFRSQWSEKMKNGSQLGNLIKQEFERRGFKFDFIITNGRRFNLDPLRYPNHALIDDNNYWDIKATIKWGEDEAGNN